MNTPLEAMKQALEAMKSLNSTLFNNDDHYCGTRQHTSASEAIANLTAAIEQMEKAEPVAYLYEGCWTDNGYRTFLELRQSDFTFRALDGEYIKGTPLYTHHTTAIHEGWQQWVQVVCEYLKESLETFEGPLESPTSKGARELLAAAPKLEDK